MPLDPASWSPVQRLPGGPGISAQNPHLVITRAMKARTDPASTAYFTHLLDSCGVPPRTVRRTHLADLVNTMDPKLVGAAFGMDPQGVMFCLTDHVDDVRLPARSPPCCSASPGTCSTERVGFRRFRVGRRGGGWVFIGHAERPGGIAVVGDYGV